MENSPENQQPIQSLHQAQTIQHGAPSPAPSQRLKKKKKKVKKTLWYKIAALFILSIVLVAAFFFYQGKKEGSIMSLYQKAESYEYKGQNVLALNEYLNMSKKYPFDPEIHIRIGKLYLKVDEPENAKLEFYTAIKMDKDKSHEAFFEMANLYARAGEYEMGEDRLKEILPSKLKTDNEKAGDFYQKWGDYKLKTNIEEAIRKYKVAHKYYELAGGAKFKKLKDKMASLYISWAQSYLKSNDTKNAISILNNADNFLQDEKIWYYLGQIYYHSNQGKAFEYYEKAFNKDLKVGDASDYIAMLLSKADALKQQNNSNSAYYYNKILTLNPKINIPYIPDKNVVVQLYSAKFSQSSTHQDQIIPGIGFKVMNASKDKLYYLKTKIVFKANNEILSTVITEIATPDIPLDGDTSSDLINIYSEYGISALFKEKNIYAEIYLSQNPKEGNWKLYRSAALSR